MICKFFLEGTCKFGPRCYNQHVIEEPKPKPEKNMRKNKSRSNKNKAKVKCTICLEVPKDCYRPEYCNHEFCFECINKWVKTNDTCPVCREQFEYLVPVQKYLNRRNVGTDNAPIGVKTFQASQRDGVIATRSSRVRINRSIPHADTIFTRVLQSLTEEYSRGGNTVNYTDENGYNVHDSEAGSDDQASFYYCVHCGNESVGQVGVSCCRFCGIRFDEESDGDHYEYNPADFNQQEEASYCRDCGADHIARGDEYHCDYCGARNEAGATRVSEEGRASDSNQNKVPIQCPVCLATCERLPGMYRCRHCGEEYDRASSDNESTDSDKKVKQISGTVADLNMRYQVT